MQILARLGHLRGLAHVGLFRTRRGVAANRSRRIQAGLEELEVLTAGRAVFDLDGRTHALRAGAMLWHQAGDETVWRTDPADPYHCMVVAFRVTAPPRPRPPRLAVPADAAETRAYVLGLRDAWDSGADRELLALNAYAGLLWRALRPAPPAPGDLPPSLRRAMAVLDRRFAERLTAADLAAAAGVGAAHLHLLMRRHLGSTPWRELARRRIDAACRLLADAPELSAAAVGARVGWGDPVHFGRVFRQLAGISPGEWRHRYRG